MGSRHEPGPQERFAPILQAEKARTTPYAYLQEVTHNTAVAVSLASNAQVHISLCYISLGYIILKKVMYVKADSNLGGEREETPRVSENPQGPGRTKAPWAGGRWCCPCIECLRARAIKLSRPILSTAARTISSSRSFPSIPSARAIKPT
jgi:hypothetical protein